MKTFISENFLLQNDFGKELYHDYAKNLPIVDYHNHLSPNEINENRIFGNISQVWLAGDHYKWRAMRALGINEEYITGKASDREKFLKWAETVPYTVRNPLYQWTHLELLRYFGIDDLLSNGNGKEIYDTTTALLQQPSHHTLGLLEQQNVEILCTTDDPIDSLDDHKSIAKKSKSLKVLPAFRPDRAYAVENVPVYMEYITSLESAIGSSIATYDDLLSALENRIAYFHKNGSRLADHGLEQLYHYTEEEFDCDVLFRKLREGKILSKDEI